MKKRSRTLARVVLTAATLALLTGACRQQQRPVPRDETQQVGLAVKQFAARQSIPAGANHRLGFHGTVGDLGQGEVCACMQVCTPSGHCSACSCSPANCGTCG